MPLCWGYTREAAITAAERTEAFERYVTADLDHVAFIGECVCRKRRLPEKVVVNFLALAVECSSAAVQPRSTEAERERLLAMCHPSQTTRLTTSACQEREHHGIAGRDFDNIRSTLSTIPAPSWPSTIGCGTG